jgi:hypothetical protein
MSVGVRFDLVIFQAADGAIHFKHGQSHIAALCNAVLANGAIQLVHADVLSGHVRCDDLPIVNQQAGFALNDAPKRTIGARKSTHQVIQQQQRGCRDNTANQRRVRTRHRILHRVGKQEKKREVERGHLPDLALAAEANADQHDKVNDSRAQRDLERNTRARGEQHSVQLAVTGTGALFGVLR